MQPFGYRVSFDIFDWQSSYLNPIDDQGYEWEQEFDANGSDHRQAGIPAMDRETFRGTRPSTSRSSSEELFTKFFQSEDDETRFSALKIAGTLPDPEDYLYDLIAEATRDSGG